MELSTYFRINASETGQFERTLIVAEEGSYVSYLEGCTAPAYDRNQLHAAVVELSAARDAEIKYSTVQVGHGGVQCTERGWVGQGEGAQGRASAAAHPACGCTPLSQCPATANSSSPSSLNWWRRRGGSPAQESPARPLFVCSPLPTRLPHHSHRHPVPTLPPTLQNWYAGDAEGRGGIYNFVTKRGICQGDRAKISWTQVWLWLVTGGGGAEQ